MRQTCPVKDNEYSRQPATESLCFTVSTTSEHLQFNSVTSMIEEVLDYSAA